MKSLPLFKQIKRTIRQKIEDKIYLPGDKIPTEFELAKQFKASRPTVNKAISELVIEGIIERFPRSGSFVKAPRPQVSIMTLQDVPDDVLARGNQYSNHLLELTRVKAPVEVAKVLQIVADEIIYMSKMIHKENNIPIRYDVRYIKPSDVPNYIEQKFDHCTPSAYLQQHSPAEKVDNSIEAILPDMSIQNYLDIDAQEPCLLISRVVISRKHPVSYSKLYYPSSRYKLNTVIY